MQTRVDGTDAGQRWRVTGLRADPEPHGMAARVVTEFWLDYPRDMSWTGDPVNILRMPLSFDPELARRLGEHLIEMSDYAQGTGHEAT